MNQDWFGEWLPGPVRCRGIRLVIEQMNEAADQVGVADLHVETNPPTAGRRQELAVVFDEPVEVLSLRHQNPSETTWVRRARVEALLDTWKTVAPSRWIDAYHRQPCRWPNTVEALDSSFLPAGKGPAWTSLFYEDLLLRTIEPVAGRYPPWLSSRYLLGAAGAPTGFSGIYFPGDSGSFNALIAAILQPEIAVESQRALADLANRFGFVPGVMGPGQGDDACTLDYSCMIWGPSCYWDLWSWTRDRDYLGWFTKAVAQWSRWYQANRDGNGDGWLEPGLNGCREATAEEQQKFTAQYTRARWTPEALHHVGRHNPIPALLLSIYECPWDDQPVYTRGRLRGMQFDPQTCSVNIHFIETQLYNAGLADFCTRAFTELGDPRQAEEFRAQARRLEGLVRDHLWDEASGFYYDRDIATGRLRTDLMHAGGFYPMIHGIPTMDQARRMVAHLLDPQKFWTPYPVPTLAQTDPDYHPTHYWSGRAWPPVNWHVLRGLIRYGFFAAADQLLARWLAQIRSCYERPAEGRVLLDFTDPRLRGIDARRFHIPDCELCVPENWNPATGEVNGSNGYTWGGLWLPAVIYRNFWPDGARHALVRPGGHLRFRQPGRWDVTVDGDRATVNGFNVHMTEATTYRLDCRTGQAEPLPLNADIP